MPGLSFFGFLGDFMWACSFSSLLFCRMPDIDVSARGNWKAVRIKRVIWGIVRKWVLHNQSLRTSPCRRPVGALMAQKAT